MNYERADERPFPRLDQHLVELIDHHPFVFRRAVLAEDDGSPRANTGPREAGRTES
jgi:hypothetical protein